MKDLKGTEKQIQWAEDLRSFVTSEIKFGVENMDPKWRELLAEQIAELDGSLQSDSAKWWIDTFKGVGPDSINILFDYVNANAGRRAGGMIVSQINKKLF